MYITLAKYLEQEGIADLPSSICLYTVFLSSELISWDESSRLLDDISDMFFIASYLACWHLGTTTTQSNVEYMIAATL